MKVFHTNEARAATLVHQEIMMTATLQKLIHLKVGLRIFSDPLRVCIIVYML